MNWCGSVTPCSRSWTSRNTLSRTCKTSGLSPRRTSSSRPSLSSSTATSASPTAPAIRPCHASSATSSHRAMTTKVTVTLRNSTFCIFACSVIFAYIHNLSSSLRTSELSSASCFLFRTSLDVNMLLLSHFDLYKYQWRCYTRARQVKWCGWKIHRPGSRPGSALPIALLCFGRPNSVNRK